MEGLLILVIIILLFGTGWYIWHSKNQTNKSLDEAASNSSTVVKQTKKASSSPSSAQSLTQSTPSTSQKYLTLKEWGLKMPLTSNISDAYYSYKNGYMYLSLQSMSSTSCSADATTLGVVSRFTSDEKDPQTDELYAKEFPNAANVGQYYYYYTHPQAACSDDQALQDKANTAMTALKAAVDKIQAE